MLTRVALKTIIHEKLKYGGAVGGVALALFLVLLQAGFYMGFRRDIVVMVDSLEADIWIMAPGVVSVDYPIVMEDLPYWRALSNPHVAAASRVIYASQYWRNPVSGGRDPIKVLGLDMDTDIEANLGVNWRRLKEMLKGPGRVAVNLKSLKRLGIEGIRAPGLEILGRHAEVMSFIRGVHLFTAFELVVTDLENAREFSQIPNGQCDFVVVKCVPGADVESVTRELRRALPDHFDVLTKAEFRHVTDHYWTSMTGVGAVLLLSTALGGLVGFLLVLNTIYVNTLENIPLFAAMKAMGASTGEIVRLLFIQIGTLFVVGTVIAALALAGAIFVISHTTISVFIPPKLVAITLGITVAISVAACAPSIRKIRRIEPGEAFTS